MFLLLLTAILFGYSAANEDWTLRNPPVIFGKTAELSCLMKTNKTNDVRIWIGGPCTKTLISYGASVDKKKYGEININHGTSVESVLQIFRFDENDIDCDYKCSIGEEEKPKKLLTLKPGDFELHPIKETTTVLTVFRNNYLDVAMKLSKVHPVPKCKITFNGVEIIKRVTTETGLNGIFFTATEILHHQFSRSICSGQLIITCLVGTSTVKIHDEQFNNCTPPEREAYKDSFVVSVILGCLLFAVVVVSLGCLARYGKLRKVLSCFVSSREDTTLDQAKAKVPMVLNKCRSHADDE